MTADMGASGLPAHEMVPPVLMIASFVALFYRGVGDKPEDITGLAVEDAAD